MRNRHLRVIALLSGLLLLASSPATVRAQADAKSPIKMTAEELVKEFKKKGADKKYKGAAVEITGKVLRPGRWISGQPYVEMRAGNDFGGVKCYTEEKEPWAKFAAGQTVRVVGKWPDFAVVAELQECKVEAIDKSPAVSLTVDELVKATRADTRAVNNKYRDATILLSGTVADKKLIAASGFTHVTLKAPGGTTVVCQMLPTEKKFCESLKAGQALKVAGRFAAAVPKEITVDSCLPITE